MMLEGLAALEESREVKVAEEAAAKIKHHETAQSGTPRGSFQAGRRSRSTFSKTKKTGRMTVQTYGGAKRGTVEGPAQLKVYCTSS